MQRQDMDFVIWSCSSDVTIIISIVFKYQGRKSFNIFTQSNCTQVAVVITRADMHGKRSMVTAVITKSDVDHTLNDITKGK